MIREIKVVLEELKEAISMVSEKDFNKLYKAINAENIFVYGQGRSGLAAEAFAMRLKQLGLNVWVVGLPTTPPITKRDLLIAVTCSGKTKLTLDVIKEARRFNAKVAVLTSNKQSKVARVADIVIYIKSDSTKQPLNSLFEQSSFIFLDAFIMFLMKKLKKTNKFMKQHHANLE